MTEEQLILDNLKLVPYIVRRSFSTHIQRYEDDLIAMGNVGLVKAARTYDESKGIKFSTYACNVIWQEIYNDFDRNYKDAVHIPQHIKDRISKQRGRDALQDFRERYAALSLDRMLDDASDSDDEYYFLESGDEPVEDQAIFNATIDHVLGRMSKRQREIMKIRLEHMSESIGDTAARVGLTRERVRQIQLEFCRKYRELKCA